MEVLLTKLTESPRHYKRNLLKEINKVLFLLKQSSVIAFIQMSGIPKSTRYFILVFGATSAVHATDNLFEENYTTQYY
jgi:hypothetical protein